MNGVENDIAFVKAGVRITPRDKGLFSNFHWNPLVNKVEKRWAWFGLGIGYCLK